MLYDKSKKNASLTPELFLDPPKEYRGAPFFAWNCALTEELLHKRIDEFKEMGFGGFFMHVRSGLSTEYMGSEFMGLIRSCVDRAKQTDMLAYLYDEDRWPSGAAGGLVTKNEKFRRKTVVLSLSAPTEFEKKTDPARKPTLLASYDIVFDSTDRLASYTRIAEDDAAKGEKWYLYLLLDRPSGWFNGYTYADILDPKATDEFLRVTHEAYKREVGDEFGKTVPAIFTDEPNYLRFDMKRFARDGLDAELPFSGVMRDYFLDSFGYDLIDFFPEVVWNKSGDAYSRTRYLYYRALTELMAGSFCDRIGKYCDENGLAFTGHVLEEPTLLQQTCAVGEAMRHYRGFTIPGIDLLCDNIELNTAKQAQSAAHQFGREGVLSELYGVTGWDFDFRGHKFQGDWQAALGITLRVPHLAWTSMEGSAKRDYPASIGGQSVWYSDYGYIEDHYARLNTALTRGKPIVRLAVVHPIESAWLLFGVREHAEAGDALDRRFADLTDWLLGGQIDFDFVSESLLEELYKEDGDGFTVGEMTYSAVLVPPLATIRKSTVERLSKFAKRGGRLITCNCPPCVDAELSDGAKKLCELSEKVGFSEIEILRALESEREISVLGGNGSRSRGFVHALRSDGENKWLFLARREELTRMDGADCRSENLKVTVKGNYAPTLYDTLSGEIKAIPYTAKDGKTEFALVSYPLDSFLILLSPVSDGSSLPPEKPSPLVETEVSIPDEAEFARGEPNVAVLDLCEWSLDGKKYFPREEILRIDSAIRKEYGYPAADGRDVQPWCIKSDLKCVHPYLRFTFESEIEAPCTLAYERAESVTFNGKEIPVTANGYFTDPSIKTMPLPPLKKGKNELIVRITVGERISAENLFLLGDFGVDAVGSKWKIVKERKKLAFGSVTDQGMPFYGAAVSYKLPFTLGYDGDLKVTTDYYDGALVSVKLDGKEVGKIVLPPYSLELRDVKKGKHTLELTLLLSRVNSFGALHACVPQYWKSGPTAWYTEGSGWSYEYCLTRVGIGKKPTVTLIKRK